jgi:hypothetical protein
MLIKLQKQTFQLAFEINFKIFKIKMNATKYSQELWNILHTLSANYPPNPTKGEQYEMKLAIVGLPALLPCGKCQNHIRQWNLQHINQLDSIVASKNKLFNYFLDLHNKVNKENGKLEWSFTRAAKFYGY